MNYPKAVKEAMKSLDEHKAEDIKVYDVRELTPFSDFYIVATAPNERALGALGDYLEEDLGKVGVDLVKKDGTPDSGWIISDFGAVLIHLFVAEKRNEVDLAGLLEHSEAKSAKAKSKAAK